MPKGKKQIDLALAKIDTTILVNAPGALLAANTTVKVPQSFREAILFDVPLAKGLKVYLEDPDTGLFPVSTLQEVFKRAHSIPLITGSQVITILVLQGMAGAGNNVIIDTIKSLSEPTGLHPKTVSKNLSKLQKAILLAGKTENGISFKAKTLLSKLPNTVNGYKLNSAYFPGKKAVTKGKGKNQRIVYEDYSGTILNLPELIGFLAALPFRLQDRAVFFYIYLVHLFHSRNKKPTQIITLSKFKGIVFYREAYHDNNVVNTIKIYLTKMKELGIIENFLHGTNRYGKEGFSITMFKNSKRLLSESKGT